MNTDGHGLGRKQGSNRLRTRSSTRRGDFSPASARTHCSESASLRVQPWSPTAWTYFCHSLIAIIAYALLPVAGLKAQTAPRGEQRPLTHQDFDAWRSITAPTLSRDGRWLAYAYMPLEGDGEVVVRELATQREHRIPIGSLPPPPVTSAAHNPERPAPRREPTVLFTSDHRFVVATLFPTLAERREARIRRGVPAPAEGVVIFNLGSLTSERIDGVKQFQVPSRGGPWIATLAQTAPPPEAAPAGGAAGTGQGTELRLRHLGTGAPDNEERTLTGVTEFSFARDGRTLVYVATSATPAQNGVFALTPGSTTAPIPLLTGPGRSRRITWDRKQTGLVFLTEKSGEGASPPTWSLYQWNRSDPTARERISSTTPGLPPGFVLSGEHAPLYSFTGDSLQVFTTPAPPPPAPAVKDRDDEERVSADLWHWQDDFLQPMQQQRAEQDRIRAYAARFDLVTGQLSQVGDVTLPLVAFASDANAAFGRDDRPYRRRSDYEGPLHDLLVVNPATGERRAIEQGLSDAAGTQWSPDGRWLAYYFQRNWFAVEARTGRRVALTQGIDARFDYELSDLPRDPVSNGNAGWTSDSSSFLAYDRYDLWQLFPDGRAPRNVTRGLGRATRTALRVQIVSHREPEDDRQGIDPREPLFLRGESELTRATGYFRIAFASDEPPGRLLWDDRAFQWVGRAAEADVLLLTASRFDRFPDLHVTTSAFGPPQLVSQGDAQRAPFLWGTAELRRYRNLDGVELPAALFKPANFDPTKKYPLIVYLYERLSQTVHSFIPPVPATTVNPSFYTSNGYAVLMPDIAYRVGEPGPSALACVMPALEEVVREGWVDEGAIGLQGHSWGGYQTAYLVTQTSRFRAAAAGAVVGNMSSAYSGISIGSGRARQYKYESEQSRIGHPVYTNPLPYVENSPVFFADRVRTPLLLLHNDGDDTVPWEQGVELFLALRRAGKEVYLFNYHHEFHGLRRRADQRDYAKRLSGFFDHLLKGAPRPEWMERGIPFLERDSEKVRFNSAP
ncbi:MAG: S9 family peptidase [Opitutaceae bacterium]|nr:S9 family peptidase [Opitutaceae bacterium]